MRTAGAVDEQLLKMYRRVATKLSDDEFGSIIALDALRRLLRTLDRRGRKQGLLFLIKIKVVDQPKC